MSDFTSITQVKVLPPLEASPSKSWPCYFKRAVGQWNTEYFMIKSISDRLPKQNTIAKYF